MRSARHPAPRPFRVELVGPAGVGKSTLSAALLRHWDAAPGSIWGRPVLPLLGNGIRMVPTFAELCWYARSPLWDESRHMVRLRTLHQALQQGAQTGSEAIVFDEGPIFVLAWLRGFGHETMRNGKSEQWWEASLAEWSRMIDAIVVLDAPDTTLAARIRTRSQPHEVKDFSDPAIAAWIARFRIALDWVLAEMTARGGPVIVRLTTDQTPPERAAERVLQELAGRRHAC
ncbi:MAG: AAA family ATPase [Gemmatimonadales bacterium]